MDEVIPPHITIDLDDDAMKKEIDLTLTVGQVQLIYNFLAQNVQPKGFDMIEFAYDLFKRLNDALDGIDITPAEESGEDPTNLGF